MEDLGPRALPLKPPSLPHHAPHVAAAVVFASLLLFGSLVGGLAGQGAPTGLTLLSKEGRRVIQVITVVNDQEFVALDDLAAVFQLAVREESGAITVSYKGKTIVLTPDQALASVAGRLISLPAAPPARGPPLARAGRSSSAARSRPSTTRGSTSAGRRTCSSSATCACRASTIRYEPLGAPRHA